MILHSELRSRRWPWLTQGWEVAKEVDDDERMKAYLQDIGVLPRPPQYFDVSTVYRPADCR